MNDRALNHREGGARIPSASDARLADLYSVHAANATRLAALLTGDPSAAEDIAHEAFARLGARVITLRHPDRAAGYLYRTIRNLAKGHGRRLSRERRLTQRVSAAIPSVDEAVPLKGPVWEALLRVPVRQRTALFLRHYLDMTEAEAAEMMGLSTAAMKSLTHRASESCRKELERSGHNERS